MKSLIKKVLVVLVVLAAFVDWPVKTDACGRVVSKVISKEAVPLFKGCARKSATAAERSVNKSTQFTKEAVENANFNAIKAKAATQCVKAKTSSQQTTCPRCYGRGSVQGSDGYVYTCNLCNGSGRVAR